MPKNLLHIMLFGIFLFSSSGCAGFLLVGGGGAVGAGTVAYFRGELKSTEETSIDMTWQATQKAMEELGFLVTSKQKDVLSAKLIARSAANKKIEINLQRITESLTEIRIRVGVFGDESLSRLILERIKKHL